MTEKRKTEAALRRRLRTQMQRPNQGPADGPYWVVMNLSQHKALYYRPPSFHFRHPTEEAAIKEAERLAALPQHAGWRFGVLAFTGISVKVEATQPTESVLVEGELQAA